MIVVVGAVLLVLGLVVAATRRARADDVQVVRVEGPRPWAGPARLNGRARVRHPSAVARPVATLVERPGPGRFAVLLRSRGVRVAALVVGAWVLWAQVVEMGMMLGE